MSLFSRIKLFFKNDSVAAPIATKEELARIDAGIDLMCVYQGEDDDFIESRLSEAGYSAYEIECFFGFAPLAFGRTVLIAMGVVELSEYTQALTQDQQAVQVPLAPQPVYARCLELGKIWSSKGQPEAVQSKVVFFAQRSSELNTLLQAQEAGNDIRGGGYVATCLLSPSVESLRENGHLK